jgi:hypothetical protein
VSAFFPACSKADIFFILLFSGASYSNRKAQNWLAAVQSGALERDIFAINVDLLDCFIKGKAFGMLVRIRYLSQELAMQCYLIDPTAKTITSENISDTADIAGLIGFDDIDFDEMDASGDRLYFDASCFIRHQPGVGRFKLDSLPPVAGKAVVIGSAAEELQAPAVSAAVLATRITFI